MDLEKVKYYAKKGLYYVPGVGLGAHYIKERRERKGKLPWYDIREAKDRKALGVYAVEIGYFALAVSWKVYVGNGIATGNWPPFKYSRDREMHKKELEMRKESVLEKTIHFDEIIK